MKHLDYHPPFCEDLEFLTQDSVLLEASNATMEEIINTDIDSSWLE